MLNGSFTSELIFLSQSRDLNIRKLRAFAASIGASARLVSNHADLLQLLSPVEKNTLKAEDRPHRMVLWDQATVPLLPEQTQAIGQVLPLVMVADPGPVGRQDNMILPSLTGIDSSHTLAKVHHAVLYFGWPIHRLLDSPVARIVLQQTLGDRSDLDAGLLMRWGHIENIWPDDARAKSLKGAVQPKLNQIAQDFAQELGLRGHLKTNLLAAARLFESPPFASSLAARHIAFASDGLLTCAIAECHFGAREKIEAWIEALSGMGCNAIMISVRNPSHWQISAIFTQGASLAVEVEEAKNLASTLLVLSGQRTTRDSVMNEPQKGLSVAS